MEYKRPETQKKKSEGEGVFGKLKSLAAGVMSKGERDKLKGDVNNKKSTEDRIKDLARDVASLLTGVKDDDQETPKSEEAAPQTSKVASGSDVFVPAATLIDQKREVAPEAERIWTETEMNAGVESTHTTLRRRSLVNMKACHYYYTPRRAKKLGKKAGERIPRSEMNGHGKRLARAGIVPDKFILKGSSALFDKPLKQLRNYQTFKKHIADRLQPKVPDRQKAAENAGLILASTCIGLYQINPAGWFPTKGWAYKGEEGLRNLYNFITSDEMQTELFESIIQLHDRKFNGDPALIAVAYYAGAVTARKYKRNPKRYGGEQIGGGRIPDYAAKARKYYKQNLAKGDNHFDAICDAVERIESGGVTRRKTQTQNKTKNLVA